MEKNEKIRNGSEQKAHQRKKQVKHAPVRGTQLRLWSWVEKQEEISRLGHMMENISTVGDK